MALDPSKCAKDITAAYLPFVGLDEYGNNWPTGEDAPPAPERGNFAKGFAKAYNDYAKSGKILGALNTGGDSSIIENYLISLDPEQVEVVPEDPVAAFAQALADFWATVGVDPGEVAHGGTAVSKVENDASSLTEAFKAAILMSLTTEEKKPYFYHLINNIEAVALSQIVWTVTELMPPTGSPTAFEESIA